MIQPSIDITRERRGEVELVRLGQGPGRPGLDLAALGRLKEILLELRVDREARVVILADGGQSPAADPENQLQAWREARPVVELILDLGKPVIGLIDGPTEGIDVEVALACTWRIGTARASFRQSVAALGILQGSGWIPRMNEIVEPSLALELLLTGRMVKTDEALQLGLLQERTETRDECEAAALRLANQICLGAPLSIKWAIESVRQGTRLSLEEGLSLESTLFARSLATADAHEGIRSFLEKRPPRFRGE